MNINFNKEKGLVPAIVQDARTLQVLMLGYMNKEAYEFTKQTNKAHFFSRSKNRIWLKGESSGNFLQLTEMQLDCDQDALLIRAVPAGPTCHKGSTSCFGEETSKGFLYQLEERIHERIDSNDSTSYTNELYRKGINKVAQKVGEEAVELVIEAKDENDDLFKNEAADLLYHLIILLKAKGCTLTEIEDVLKQRMR